MQLQVPINSRWLCIWIELIDPIDLCNILQNYLKLISVIADVDVQGVHMLHFTTKPNHFARLERPVHSGPADDSDGPAAGDGQGAAGGPLGQAGHQRDPTNRTTK